LNMAYQRWCDIASLSWYDLTVVRLITTWERLYRVFFTAILTSALSLVPSPRRSIVAAALLSASSSFSAVIAYATHSVFLLLATFATTFHRLCEQSAAFDVVGILAHRFTSIFVHTTVPMVSAGEGFCLILRLLFAYGQSALSMNASYMFLLFAILADRLDITVLIRLFMTSTITLLSGLEGVLRFIVKVVPKKLISWNRVDKPNSLWIEQPKE
jgi:hypothetical protein